MRCGGIPAPAPDLLHSAWQVEFFAQSYGGAATKILGGDHRLKRQPVVVAGMRSPFFHICDMHGRRMHQGARQLVVLFRFASRLTPRAAAEALGLIA
jgi:hypothetical protein